MHQLGFYVYFLFLKIADFMASNKDNFFILCAKSESKSLQEILKAFHCMF